MWVLSVGFEWKLFTRAHIEFKRQSQISLRQRWIWGRNFKTKLLTSSVFSCFLPSIFIHLSIQHNLTLKRKKQENTEKVWSLVLKFLPQILLCLTLICDCLLNSMWALSRLQRFEKCKKINFHVFLLKKNCLHRNIRNFKKITSIGVHQNYSLCWGAVWR